MILDCIVEDKKKRLEEQKKQIPLEQMKRLAASSALLEKVSKCSFYDALAKPGMSIIGEFKKASPSLGTIKSEISLEERIAEYNASVDAISCLTEEDHFHGNIGYLKEIRKRSKLPILRKDFMIDEYQFYEAKVIGADAVLLIAAILTEEQMKAFYQLAKELGLDVLVEVHNEEELERAIRIGANIIGVNNRNLSDFSISLETTRQLAQKIPEGTLLVAESGIQTDEDVKTLAACGADAFLIGRALMEAKEPQKVAEHWKQIGGCPQVKICGITSEKEVGFLNQMNVSYVGFVLYEKSKRYVTIEQAKQIFGKLNQDIRKVAVVVNPDQKVIKEVEQAGFDILQIHGKVEDEVLEAAKLPIWLAVNLDKNTMGCKLEQTIATMGENVEYNENLNEVKTRYNKVKAILFDGALYGGGKTFDWSQKECEVKRWRSMFGTRKLVLAGGLTKDNVATGIRIFSPDIVDVSSGVEREQENGGFCGKDFNKIRQFIDAVYNRAL